VPVFKPTPACHAGFGVVGITLWLPPKTARNRCCGALTGARLAAPSPLIDPLERRCGAFDGEDSRRPNCRETNSRRLLVLHWQDNFPHAGGTRNGHRIGRMSFPTKMIQLPTACGFRSTMPVAAAVQVANSRAGVVSVWFPKRHRGAALTAQAALATRAQPVITTSANWERNEKLLGRRRVLSKSARLSRMG
jgi:hypothetical protein